MTSQCETLEKLQAFKERLEGAQTAFTVADHVEYVHVIGDEGFKPRPGPKNEAIATLRQILTSSIANVQHMISIRAAEASVVHENEAGVVHTQADMSTLLRRMKELNGSTWAY